MAERVTIELVNRDALLSYHQYEGIQTTMGTEKATVIEINGKLYDVRTGKLVTQQQATATIKKAPTRAAVNTHKGRTIDGVAPRIKTKHSVTAPPATTKAKPVLQRPQAATAKRRSQQRPQTLMRRSVLKPQKNVAPIKVHAPVAGRPLSGIVARPKISANTVHTDRLASAKAVPKSPAVSRFGKPAVFTPTTLDAASIKAAKATAEAPHASEPKKSASKAYFEKALATATSHEAVKPKSKAKKLSRSFKRQRSIFAVAASASVLVIVGAFVLVSNMSSLEVKVASLRAGVHASLPKYQPSGFSKAGPVAFKSGKVTIAFKANDASNRSYKVEQQESNWDSTSLYDSLIASSGKSYQTVQQQGNTIYLYGDSQAAWVSGGVLYQITGNARLNNQQLLDIAASV